MISRVRPISVRLFGGAAAWLAAICLAGCSKEKGPAAGGGPGAAASGPAPEPERNWRADLEQATQGRKIRVVWAQHAASGGADVGATGKDLILVGLDSQDGRGVRQIVPDKRNYHRPLFKPDGSGVVYTELGAAPQMFMAPWEGGEVKPLGQGRAVALWRDGPTQREWVYAHEAPEPMFPDGERRDRIVRFTLDKPGEREVVWAQTLVGTDNVQLSRDGLRMAAMLPAPNVCLVNLEDSTSQELGNGLWPAIAPDNSYVAWGFDADRGALRLTGPSGEGNWEVSLSAAPGMGNGAYVWHPRWSNNPALITFTGPYAKPPHDPGYKDAADGAKAEVFIARLGPAAKELLATVRITQNDRADVYPDLWMEGPPVETLGNYAQKPRPTPKVPELPWPANKAGAVFAWENLAKDVDLPAADGTRKPRVTAKRYARFGRNLEMVLSGGCFEADPASNAAIAAECKGSPGFAFEMLLTESRDGYGPLSVRLLSYRMADGRDAFALYRVDTSLVLRLLLGKEGEPPKSYPIVLARPRIDASRPFHLAVSVYGKIVRTYLDQALQSEITLEGEGFAHWGPGTLQLGDLEPYGDKWKGGVEEVAIYNRYLGEEEMKKNFNAAKVKMAVRRPADRVNLQGKLIEMTPIPPPATWAPYPRILVGYTYEVARVTAGICEDPKIVVAHYAGMDNQPVPHFPREIGKTYKLSVEPLSQHPELKSERVENTAKEFNVPVYVDIETPGEDHALKP